MHNVLIWMKIGQIRSSYSQQVCNYHCFQRTVRREITNSLNKGDQLDPSFLLKVLQTNFWFRLKRDVHPVFARTLIWAKTQIFETQNCPITPKEPFWRLNRRQQKQTKSIPSQVRKVQKQRPSHRNPAPGRGKGGHFQPHDQEPVQHPNLPDPRPHFLSKNDPSKAEPGTNHHQTGLKTDHPLIIE